MPLSGQFFVTDLFGNSLILEWKKTDITSQNLADFKRNISEIASLALAPIEMQFLRTYPEAVTQELFLMPCAPLFASGIEAVDWNLVDKTIQGTIKQFYQTDLSTFGADIIKPLLDDVYFIVSIKESKGEQILGFAMFAITPELPCGDVKVIQVAVAQDGDNRELDKLLMSTIFAIIPDTKRLFTFVRPTNEYALRTYSSWGFAENKNGFQDPNHKVNMEYLRLLDYKAERNKMLQKIAEGLLNAKCTTITS